MKKTRIGIIGCGGIANGKHLGSLSLYPDRVEIVAFCDIILSRAEAAAKKFGTPDAAVYADYHELLSDQTIDAVHVCTPNASHCKITVAALEAGKHVMCEKPMALTAAEGQLMVDAAEKTGKLLTVGTQNRHREDVKVLKHLVEQGQLGDIYYARARGIMRRRVPTHGVFLDQNEQGGGALIDISPHALDVTLSIMNNFEPKSVMAKTFDFLGKGLDPKDQGNALGPWDNKSFSVEDSAIGFLTMKNGAVVIVEAAWAMNAIVNDYAMTTLCGTKAGASMEDGSAWGKPYKLFLNDVTGGKLSNREIDCSLPMGENKHKLTDFALPSYRECGCWLDAIEGKAPVAVTPQQALVVTKIIEGMYISARTGELFNF